MLRNVLLQVLLIVATFGVYPQAHQLGAHGLHGQEPPPIPQLPEITGPFEFEVTVRWDDLTMWSWQTVFEYSNNNNSAAAVTSENAIWFGQVEKTDRVRLVVWDTSSNEYSFVEAKGIVAQETATWKGIVDETGFLWLYKNNDLMNSVQGSTVPPNVIRHNKLLAQSTLPDATSLYGAVLGIRIRNLTNRAHLQDLDFLNLPGQVFGPFTATFYARFDDVNGRNWQKVFDFGNGPNEHNVWFGAEGNTANAVFQIHLEDGTEQTIKANGVLIQGEWAHWHVGIAHDHMFIEKNDMRVAEGIVSVLHPMTFRRKMLVGESHWNDQHHPLQGVVLGLRVDLHTAS